MSLITEREAASRVQALSKRINKAKQQEEDSNNTPKKQIRWKKSSHKSIGVFWTKKRITISWTNWISKRRANTYRCKIM